MKTVLLSEWRDAIAALGGIVTPDSDGYASVPSYGSSFEESDNAPIPPGDLPFGLAAWFGDDAWGRQDTLRHKNCVARPSRDLSTRSSDRHPKASRRSRANAHADSARRPAARVMSEPAWER
jgi:hypothetical protein